MSHASSDLSGISRRGFLALTGGLGAAVAGITACDTGYREPSGAKGTFHIPDPRKSLPDKDVTFRLVDSGDTKKPFWEAFFQAYQEKHQNITVKYDGMLVNRMDEVIPLGIRNGTAHDVFQLPPSITIQKAVAEGWVAPFDDLVPDIEKWKQKFPEGTFAEGQQIHDGKLYMVPLGTEQRHFCLLHYDKQLMDKAGYDPAEKPLTVDEFRDAARKMTKKSEQVYGVVLEIGQPNRLVPWVEYMARKAGVGIVNGDGIDARDGEFFFTRPEILEAVEVVLALKKDGSLFPGSNSLSAPEAWPRVVRGGAGMVSGGPWVAAQWQNDSPEFEFGVAEHPTPVDDPLPLGYTLFGSDSVCIYAKSKLKNVAADVLSYVLSDEGQTRWGEIVNCGNPPIFEKARAKAAKGYSAQGKQCVALADAMVANPQTVVANPDVALVNQELATPVVEDFGAVIQAIMVGEETNPKKALADLAGRRNQMLDDAIAAATKKGAKVSREDWVFSNWSPRKDYLPSDYKGR